MTEKEKHDIAEIVIRKMLEAKAKMEADLFNINDVLFTLLNTQLTEEELLVGELARLMTLLNTYEDKEEYEKAAIVLSKLNTIKSKLRKGDYNDD